MARQEKGSRMRMLPPRVQLQQSDALTGSYPTNVRFSIDGRTGDYPINYDDTYTVNFVSSLNYIPAVGFPTGDIWLANSQSNDLSASIITTGSVRSQVIEGLPFFHFTPGQDLTPFRDNNQPAVDGKSTNNPFYATGSAENLVGEGFNSPLWSKNKIEIDISVSEQTSFYLSGSLISEDVDYNNTDVPNSRILTKPPSTLGTSYEMCYFNFVNKKWEGAGTGLPFNSQITYTPAGFPIDSHLNTERLMMGFAPSIINWGTQPDQWAVDSPTSKNLELTGSFELMASAGQPTTTLGFPYHPKFHATSSQLLDMSQYINEPFLLEKIVVEMSASYEIYNSAYNAASYKYVDPFVAPPGSFTKTITSITQSTIPAAINNLFILKQKNLASFNVSENNSYDGNLTIWTQAPTYVSLSAPKGTPTAYVKTAREIITWGGITSFAQNMFVSGTRAGTPRWAGAPVADATVNIKSLMERDYNIYNKQEAHADLTSLSWSGSFSLTLPAKSPVEISTYQNNSIAFHNVYYGVGGALNAITRFRRKAFLNFARGRRTGLGMQNVLGSSYVSEYSALNASQTSTTNPAQILAGAGSSTTLVLVPDQQRYKYNPILLQPTDQLILGWQQPLLAEAIAATTAQYASVTMTCNMTFPTTTGEKISSITFLPGNAKLILYGSYIREGREYNDGTNQLLSSDSIHEVIE